MGVCVQASVARVDGVVVVTTTAGRAGVDHQGRGLGRHSEVTGVDTIVLGQLDARAIDGCRGHPFVSS